MNGYKSISQHEDGSTSGKQSSYRNLQVEQEVENSKDHKDTVTSARKEAKWSSLVLYFCKWRTSVTAVILYTYTYLYTILCNLYV